MSEHHSTSFEYFDLHVKVTDEGDVNIVFTFPDKFESLSLQWDDLREVIEFVGRHGLGLNEPYVVDTRGAITATLEK